MFEKIQVFTPKYRVEECLQEVRECLEIGWTGMGFKTTEIEKQWCKYTGLPHSHFLNSATAALHVAIAMFKHCDKWEDGDEIITTPLTFVSSNHAILYEKLKPVFADIDRHLCLDPVSVEAAITPRTRAVMFVALGGNTGQLKAIAEICKRHKLRLILDAAHMAGSRLDGQDPGLLADVTCYSFQAVKNLPTADSGMVCFQDTKLDEEARKFSWLGINKDTYARSQAGNYKWKYGVEYAGFKYNGSAIMAGLALVGLKYLDEDNTRRREIAAKYDSLLGQVDWIDRVEMASDCVSARHLYQIMIDDRDSMIEHLNKAEIFPGVHYRDNTEYDMYANGAGLCPRAKAASDRLLTLPIHLRLTDADIERVSAAVLSFRS
ncbi:DegT/DnrJ/EryC1/StrS aminotransferase family protein [Aquidulcibacter sp.]|uniref:DegT/DnrJ/EryC1/StrS family aminotransferase n=1 Tax=Aquidulcibacter sp. TaxID=2052990 RepID=UPI0025BEA4BE|nr:DegT/DnrJ/EryC1/StrS aminotransferase family protein [Aquidulcibacter sp.]MCA3692986.1 DegT/DnrJ/EryC1/StrS aminotransferase family protein [Aquidulcibacter sp.]